MKKYIISFIFGLLALTVSASHPFMNSELKESLKGALEYYNIHHSDIVYAQAVWETGNFNSQLCKQNNNLFGLYDSKNKCYYKFDHWIDCIIAYKNMIQYKYKEGEDYYSFLTRIGYASDPNYNNHLKNIIK